MIFANQMEVTIPSNPEYLMRSFTFSLFVSLLLLVPSALRGDHVLEYDVQETRTSHITHKTIVNDSQLKVFAGSDRCRIDGRYGSYILRTDLGKLWAVFAQNKTYWEFDAPLRLEDEVAEGSRETLSEASRYFAALVEVTPADEAAVIGDWRAKLWRASVQQPLAGFTRDLEIWLATGLDMPSYRELSRNFAALNVFDRDWISDILALEGLEVKYEEKRRSSSRSEVLTRTLVSLREEALDKELFEIPEGYERTDFQLDAVFAIQAPREMPSRDP